MFGSSSSHIKVLFLFLILLYCVSPDSLQYRYGRKPVLFTTLAVQTIFMCAQAFSPSWIVFCILLFFGGLGQIANYMSAFVLGTNTSYCNYRQNICSTLDLSDLSYKVVICSCPSVCIAPCAGMETLTGKVRILFSTLGVCLSFSIGYMILPLLAYFFRDWKSLLLGLSLPCLIFIPFWW